MLLAVTQTPVCFVLSRPQGVGSEFVPLPGCRVEVVGEARPKGGGQESVARGSQDPCAKGKLLTSASRSSAR